MSKGRSFWPESDLMGAVCVSEDRRLDRFAEDADVIGGGMKEGAMGRDGTCCGDIVEAVKATFFPVRLLGSWVCPTSCTFGADSCTVRELDGDPSECLLRRMRWVRPLPGSTPAGSKTSDTTFPSSSSIFLSFLVSGESMWSVFTLFARHCLCSSINASWAACSITSRSISGPPHNWSNVCVPREQSFRV